jgi:hypothetical protein
MWTFELGQSINWPPAPMALAQVVELRRSRVRVLYRCRTGRVRQPLVPARDLAALQEIEPPLPLPNAMDRAAMRGRKTFVARGGGQD